MADDEYQKKVRDLQKYVPFLENTIRRLKTETGKPREAQISKLQSLLQILTDTKKKLKYDALKKCEEVILKLYEKVEKKIPADSMHKYKCRTPPCEKNEATFSIARQKLNKQVDLTPASPSPPPEPSCAVPAPVMIPTEKIASKNNSNNRTFTATTDTAKNTNQYERDYVEDGWCDGYNNDYNKNNRWQRPIFENRFSNMPPMENRPPFPMNRPPVRPITYPGRVWQNEDANLYQRRGEIVRPRAPKFNVWNHVPYDVKGRPQNRDLVTYNNPFSEIYNNLESPVHYPVTPKNTATPSPVPPPESLSKKPPEGLSKKPPEKELERPKPPEPKRELISIKFPPKPILPTSAIAVITSTLNKPPLSESDLQDLLSPTGDSPTSEEQSPLVDEAMDLEQLEQLREQLSKELEENNKPAKEKEKPKPDSSTAPLPTVAPPPPPKPKPAPRVIERVVKESENIFGNLLSSIDEQIMVKTKESKKIDKKDGNKKDDSSKKEIKRPDSREGRDKDRYKADAQFRDRHNKDDRYKSRSSSSSSSSKDRDKRDTSKVPSVKDISKLNDRTKANYFKDSKPRSGSDDSKKRVSKHTEDKYKSESKYKDLDSSSSKEAKDASRDEKAKMKTESSEAKDSNKSQKADDSKFQNKSVSDKTSDKSHSSSISDSVNTDEKNKDGKEEEKLLASVRLSDKYPHKRRPSTASRTCDVEEVNKSKQKFPNTEVHPLKLTDPRLRNPQISSYSTDSTDKFSPKKFPECQSPNIFPPFNKDPSPNSNPNQMVNNFGQDNQANGRPHIFPGESHGRPPQMDTFQPGNMTPGPPGSMTPGDPFAQNFDPFVMNHHFPNNFNQDQRPDQFWNRGNQNQNQFHMPHNQFERPQIPFAERPAMYQERPNIPPWGQAAPVPNFPQGHPRFPNPGGIQQMNYPQNEQGFNQYDLSKMNPIDFYDTSSEKQNAPNLNNEKRIPTVYDHKSQKPGPNNRSYRGRGANNRGSFRGRGNDRYRWNIACERLPTNDDGKEETNKQSRYPGEDPKDEPHRKYGANKSGRFSAEERKDKLSNTSETSSERRGDVRRDGRFSADDKKDRFLNDEKSRSNIDDKRFANEEKRDRDPRFSIEEKRDRDPRFSNEEKRDRDPRFLNEEKRDRDPRFLNEDKRDKDPRFSNEEKRDRDPRFSNEEKRDRDRRLSSDSQRNTRLSSEERRDKHSVEGKKDRSDEKRDEPQMHDDLSKKDETALAEKTNKPEKDPKESVKVADEISSPLDCLYSQETKQVGKGYGFQKFKIPKIKRASVEDNKEDHKTIKKEIANDDLDKLPDGSEKDLKKSLVDAPMEEAVTPEPNSEVQIPEQKSPEEKATDEKSEMNVVDFDEVPKEQKVEMFDQLMRNILSACGKNVLLQLLDSADGTLSRGRTRRIRRILESDSEDSDEEAKEKSEIKTERDVTPAPEDLQKPSEKKEEVESSSAAETVVESVGERIKNRRRRPLPNYTDSSPEKGSTVDEKPELEEPGPAPEPEEPEPKQKVKKSAKARRKNDLEKLQDDIREMFISQGVLTATGKRMCRMMKEHQDSVLNSASQSEKKKKAGSGSEDDEDVPLTRRKSVQRNTRARTNKALVKALPKRTRSSPRVVLEKINIEEVLESSDGLSDEDLEPEEGLKRPTRRAKQQIVSYETPQEPDESETSPVKDLDKKKSPAVRKAKKIQDKNADTDSLDDNVALSDLLLVNEAPPKSKVAPKRVIGRKKAKRKNWALGVIKKKPRAGKTTEKILSSPSLTSISDRLSVTDTLNDLDSVELDHDSLVVEPEADVSDNEEYSLLTIDLTPDVNYYLDNGNKFDCKLCEYKGKLIVHHYRTKHPESENMISRLSPEQAEVAKTEALASGFAALIPFEEVVRNKKRRTNFCCRFCGLVFRQELASAFYDHISCHTGEYRYACEVCPFYTGIRKNLSTHCHNLHPNLKRPIGITPKYPDPPNFRLVFGYLCQACNFTQLLSINVEKHVKVAHPNNEVHILKISMSTRAVALTDLKPDAKTIIEKAHIAEPTSAGKEPSGVVESPVESTTVEEAFATDEDIEVDVENDGPDVVDKTVDLPKEPDMTVFMESDDISHREKLIEDERLKKMQEVISNITPRRSTLQFVDKLKNKLENARTSLEENVENVDDIPEAPTGDEEPNKEPQEKWIEITSTCSLANMETSLTTESSESSEPSQSQQPEESGTDDFVASDAESAGEYPESIDVASVDLDLQACSKQKGVLGIIQRLAAKLQNPPTSNVPVLDPPPLEKAPSLEPPSLELATSLEPVNRFDTAPVLEPATKNDEEQIINVGAIEIRLKDNDHQYLCMIPDCFFTTLYKISFRKHCSEQHQGIIVPCELCRKQGVLQMPFTMTSLFVHLFSQHKGNAKELDDKIQPGKIRIRRISGDVLSSRPNSESPKAPQPQSIFQLSLSQPQLIVSQGQLIVSQAQMNLIQSRLNINQTSQMQSVLKMGQLNMAQPHLNATDPLQVGTSAPPQDSQELPGGFFQISNVRTLTPEEENNLQLKFAATPSKPAETADANQLRKKPLILKTQKILVPVKSLLRNLNLEQEMRPLLSYKMPEIVKVMLEYPKLRDLYKCPIPPTCTYSSSIAAEFAAHFSTHMTAVSGEFCVYCAETVRTGNLTGHIFKFHAHCLYQCAYCFFRAVVCSYVTYHQKIAHPGKSPTVHILPGVDMTQIVTSQTILPRKKAILPFHCNQENCKCTFLIIADFMIHLQAVHKKYYCTMCQAPQRFGSTTAIVNHYVAHCIALYQCRFCLFGAQKTDDMFKHYAKLHPNQKPVAYVRQFKSKSKILIGEEEQLLDIDEVNLDELNGTLLQEKDVTFLKDNEKIIYPSLPATTQSSTVASVTQQPTPSTSSLLKTALANTTSTKTSTETLPSSNFQVEPITMPQTKKIIDVIDLSEDIAEAEMNLPASDDLNEPLVTLKHRSVESRDAIVNAVDPLTLEDPESLQMSDNSFDMAPTGISFDEVPKIPEKRQEENDNSDSSINPEDDDGKTGFDLFRCATPECHFKASNLKDFKSHMYVCDVLKVDGGWYMCIHCQKRFKFVGGLTEHILVHGPRRFTCSMCSQREPLSHVIVKHLKVKHKIYSVRMAPADPTKTDPNSDRFIAMPSKSKTKKLKDPLDPTLASEAPLSVAQSGSKVEEKNMFGPEDIDLLPRPPVYSQEIKCKLCSYNTKVRSNMQRHLQQHIEEKYVPETAPVNPVPCLEKNEKMFDKMTNLAASSHTGRMGGKSGDKLDKSGLKKNEGRTYPGFVQASKRYVCGAEGCSYLTHGDAMLRHHLSALHLDEPSYKCPHCRLELCTEVDGLTIDNILFHLKMHDLHLYKCTSCDFYHYQRHKIERHCAESHPDRPKSIDIMRELDSSANLDDDRPSVPVAEPPDLLGLDKPWRCGFCSFKTSTRTEIQNHAAQDHGIKSQFKCGRCHFRCSARNNYTSHFKTKHPNCEVDIVSVYYKMNEESPVKATVQEVAPERDTTPLWSKNKTGVKHIRGILLDSSSKFSKKATIKATPEKEIAAAKVVYGVPEKILYVCPYCNDFRSKSIKEFTSHLHSELKYYRYSCSVCDHKSVDIQQAQDHWLKTHPQENNTEHIVPLSPNGKLEHLVEKCLKDQRKEMAKFEEQQQQNDDLNSSHETVLGNFDSSSTSPEISAADISLNTPTSSITPVISSVTSLNTESPASEVNIPPEEFITPLRMKEVETLPSTGTIVEASGETSEDTFGDASGESPVEPEEGVTPAQEAGSKKADEVEESPAPSQITVSSRTSSSPSTSVKDTEFSDTTDNKSNSASPNKDGNLSKEEEAKKEAPEEEVETQPSPANKSPLKCLHCSFVGKTRQTLNKHMKRHFTHKPFQCKLCQYQCLSQGSMSHHFGAKHTGQALMYEEVPPPKEPQFRPIKRKRRKEDAEPEPVDAKIPQLETAEATPPAETAVSTGKVSDLVSYYICYHCPRRSEELEVIRSHFIQFHEKVYKGVFKYKKLTVDPKKKSVYQCKYCGWLGATDALKSHHHDQHSDKPWVLEKAVKYRCNFCLEVFDKVGLLRRHFTTAHPTELLSYQTIAHENSEECLDTVEIVEELLEKTEDTQIQCEYCPDTFDSAAQLVSHHNLLHSHLELKLVDLHSGDPLKQFKCPKCEHASNSYAAMRDHLRGHNKPYKCKYCPLTGCYPSGLKAHHLKEHRNLKFVTLGIPKAWKLYEELRQNLLILQPDGTYRTKTPTKRHHPETADEPPAKVPLLETPMDVDSSLLPPPTEPPKTFEDLKVEEAPKRVNVAKKSTARPPKPTKTYLAKKNSTSRSSLSLPSSTATTTTNHPPGASSAVEGFSYYGTKPCDINNYKNVMSEINIMGKVMPINVDAMRHVLNLFPTIVLEDCKKKPST